MMKMMNPVQMVQDEIAGMLEAEPWFKAHRVTIIRQNAQQLAFLLKKSMSSLGGVALVVGVDRITNDHTALDCEITVTCTEHVMTNRAKQGYATAIDACQAAVQMIDGEWWHFFTLQHTTEHGTDTLQATANFRGLVDRVFLRPNTETSTTPATA